MNPTYPIKPQTTKTGSRFIVVSLQQDDGRYVAEIAGSPTIRFVANTRRQAERVVTKMYLEGASRKARHDHKEDRLWLQLARANGDEHGITVDQYRQRRDQVSKKQKKIIIKAVGLRKDVYRKAGLYRKDQGLQAKRRDASS